jgi:hypothetical protein
MVKSFERWEREELELTFGLQQVKDHPVLIDWLTATEAITEEEKLKIEPLRLDLESEISYWNEEEVKIFFINDLVKLINFKRLNSYKLFAQRTISAHVKDLKNNELELRGRIEILVATGRQKPRQPFFFIHEYKPIRSSASNDPEGQLLVAMVATQALNETPRPIYGLYVQGKFWNFVTLLDKEYSISASYDATKPEDLYQIVRILKRCKFYIERFLGLIK